MSMRFLLAFLLLCVSLPFLMSLRSLMVGSPSFLWLVFKMKRILSILLSVILAFAPVASAPTNAYAFPVIGAAAAPTAATALGAVALVFGINVCSAAKSGTFGDGAQKIYDLWKTFSATQDAVAVTAVNQMIHQAVTNGKIMVDTISTVAANCIVSFRNWLAEFHSEDVSLTLGDKTIQFDKLDILQVPTPVSLNFKDYYWAAAARWDSYSSSLSSGTWYLFTSPKTNSIHINGSLIARNKCMLLAQLSDDGKALELKWLSDFAQINGLKDAAGSDVSFTGFAPAGKVNTDQNPSFAIANFNYAVTSVGTHVANSNQYLGTYDLLAPGRHWTVNAYTYLTVLDPSGALVGVYDLGGGGDIVINGSSDFDRKPSISAPTAGADTFADMPSDLVLDGTRILGADLSISADGAVENQGSIAVPAAGDVISSYNDALLNTQTGIATGEGTLTGATGVTVGTGSGVISSTGTIVDAVGEITNTGASSTDTSISKRFDWTKNTPSDLTKIFPFSLPGDVVEFFKALQIADEPIKSLSVPFKFANIDETIVFDFTHVWDLADYIRPATAVLAIGGTLGLALYLVRRR